MAEHQGCRVCGRTDVSLTKGGVLRQHVHADLKGLAFGNRCPGAGHPPKGFEERVNGQLDRIQHPSLDGLEPTPPPEAETVGGGE